MTREIIAVNKSSLRVIMILGVVALVGCPSSKSPNSLHNPTEDASVADSGGNDSVVGDAGEEQCLVNPTPYISLSEGEYCLHTGPEKHQCCSLVATGADMSRGCAFFGGVVECYVRGPIGDSLSCAWGQSETCHKKTLADGGVEIWLTNQNYDFSDQEELIGEYYDGPECETAKSLPPCPEGQ